MYKSDNARMIRAWWSDQTVLIDGCIVQPGLRHTVMQALHIIASHFHVACSLGTVVRGMLYRRWFAFVSYGDV